MHKLCTHLSFISITMIESFLHDSLDAEKQIHTDTFTWKNKEVFQAPVELWESMSTHSCSTTAIALRYLNLIQPFRFNCGKAEEHGNAFSLVFERQAQKYQKVRRRKCGWMKSWNLFPHFSFVSLYSGQHHYTESNYSSAQAWCNVHIIQAFRSGLIIIQWDNLLDHNK